MITLFNPELSDRLASLQAALEAEADIAVSRATPLAKQPVRVVIRSGVRVLTFGLDMAQAVGAQLAENGYGIGDEIKAAANG